jgi:hypothetical protein
MQDFGLWFSTGLQHICDWKGYDHILFVCALCIPFAASEWKKLLILITAFTVGHSITLALSVLNILQIPQNAVEFLIPLTIIFTCVHNIIKRRQQIKTTSFNFIAAAFFGCIHGLGFSYLLKSLLGKEGSIIGPLFSFNLGLEAGQLIIVAGILVISLTLPLFFKIKKEQSILIASSAISGIAILMAAERITNLY